MDYETRKMPDDGIVCYCDNVTKGQIIAALKDGAATLEDVRKATGACTTGNCRELSPRKRCCAPVIKQIIREFMEDQAAGEQ